MQIPKKLKFERGALASVVNFLPGLVILIFSMMALYSSLLMIEEHERLIDFFREEITKTLELEEKFNPFERAAANFNIEKSPENLEALRGSLKSFSEEFFEIINTADPNVKGLKLSEYSEILLEIRQETSSLSVIVESSDIASDEKLVQGLMSHASELDERIETLWSLLSQDKQSDEIFRLMKGRERMVYWSVIAVGLTGFLLIILNSEKLKRLERINAEKRQALVLLEYRLAAMEASFDGIVILDGDFNINYMNRAFMDIHGRKGDGDEFLGNPWIKIYGPTNREVMENAILPMLTQKGFWFGNISIHRPDETIADVELSLTKLQDGGFIGTMHDISDKIRADQEKEHLQAQFFQAQKMEAIGRLAGGIAHDFNNILAAMNGYAEFLTEDLEEGSQQHKFAANILQAGKQARDLVDQILTFSRRNDASSRDPALDLIDPLTESLGMLHATLPKTLEVVTNVNLNTALIRGNATQMSQVIMNLCVNARDAMGDDHGILKIGLEEVDPVVDCPAHMLADDLPSQTEMPPIRIDDVASDKTRLVLSTLARGQRYICLSVEDTGSGMPRVIMEHIFEPFFTTKPVDKGTGLGLATVHGVLTSHQGALLLESTISKGTVFKLYFPLMDQEVQVERKDKDQGLTLGSGRILLVDDQPDVRDMTLNMLERIGYEALACQNGLEALNLIRESPDYFDLVLTDQNMPKMTGLELINQVSAQYPSMPFIILSGYSQEKLQDMMQENPAIKAVLRKPVTKENLAHKINAVIGGRQSSAAA